MNNVALIGRLTKDVDTRYTQGQNPMAISRYTLAVDRPVKKEGQPTADFISCVCFGKTAEFAEKYLKKGNKVGVSGRLQTGSYEKDGVKHYTTDVIVDSHTFCESKNTEAAAPQAAPSDVGDGFMDMSQQEQEELPFY